jgi:hypothetical protein
MQWLWRNNSNTLALVLCAKSSDVAAVPSVLQTANKLFFTSGIIMHQNGISVVWEGP